MGESNAAEPMNNAKPKEVQEYNEEELFSRAEELRNKIMEIKDQRRSLIEEIKELRAQRRRLIEEKRTYTTRLKELKERRAELLDELNKLKEERDKLREQLNSKREQLRIARELAAKEGNLARISLKRLQRRLEELEWKQMTTVLPPHEEERLIAEISRLEDLIDRVRRAKQQFLSVMELEAEIKSLRLRYSDVVSKINEIRERIGEIKNEMQALIQKIEEYNSKIDALGREIEERSAIVNDLNKQLDQLYPEYREIMIKLKELKIAKQYRITVEALEKRRKEVLEKYKRGEPLTLDELKILYGEFDAIA